MANPLREGDRLPASKAQTTAKRRYPGGKGKAVLYATFEDHPEPLDYVTAREKVYVKEYYDLIKDRTQVHYYEQLFSKCVRILRSAYVERTLDIQMLKSGRSITIYDFDGPRTEDGGVTCLELDLDVLRSKIRYLPQPFGHGYVVGSRILGLVPGDYTRPL